MISFHSMKCLKSSTIMFTLVNILIAIDSTYINKVQSSMALERSFMNSLKWVWPKIDPWAFWLPCWPIIMDTFYGVLGVRINGKLQGSKSHLQQTKFRKLTFTTFLHDRLSGTNRFWISFFQVVNTLFHCHDQIYTVHFFAGAINYLKMTCWLMT